MEITSEFPRSLAPERPHLCSRIVIDNELALRVPDREHWARCRANDVLRDATREQPLHRLAAVCAHHNEIDV